MDKVAKKPKDLKLFSLRKKSFPLREGEVCPICKVGVVVRQNEEAVCSERTCKLRATILAR